MLTTAISPEAVRQRRCRRRQREGLSLAQAEVPAGVIEALIAGGWLAEDGAEDPRRLGEALLNAAEERLRQGR